MRHRILLKAGRALVPAAALAFLACSDVTPPVGVDERASPASPPRTAAQLTHHELARLVALSLADPSSRSALRQALATSTVKEGKLHLAAYLRAGGPLLAALVRAGGVSEAAVFDLLDQVGSLEIYLPVVEHRARWNGGRELIVAVQLDEDQVPFGVDLDGRPVPLSLAGPPATPTLSIVPAESFDAQGRSLQRGRAKSTATTGSPGAALAATAWTGIWINEVHVGNLHESWTRGSPEFEMHLENAATDPRTTIICAEEDFSVEPYRWDMDAKDYYDAFLIAAQDEIPDRTRLVISMWEDDDGRCVLKTYDGDDLVKLVTDYLNAVSDIYKAIEYKRFVDGQLVIALRNAYITGRALISGGDDFVGVAAGRSKITTTEKTLVLKDQNAINQGYLRVQWRTGTAE